MEEAKVWNKEVFENIFKRKRVFLARLNGIQMALERYNSDKLKNLENELLKELDEMMLQEDVFWNKKSIRDWTYLGNRNTAFFSSESYSEKEDQSD
ncbi:hypothetical protein DITRI_Ditri03aG0149800 [Diplodiscus trichospermus]